MIDVSDLLWFRLLAGLMLGLSLGSFITMLTYRLPRRLSIVRPPSHCTNCQARLAMGDLVPILSWLRYQGKCSHCGVSISMRYPLIEAVTALLTMLAFTAIGFHISLVLAIVIIVGGVSFLTISFERKEN